MMRHLTTAALACSMFVSVPIFVGCDRTLKTQETTKTDSNGNTVSEQTTKKEQPDGTIVTEHSKSTDNTNNNP